MKYFFKISIILSVAIFISCADNLELTPVSQISNSSFWKTESDALGALNGAYARFRNATANNLYLWGEARSEIMGPSLAGTSGFELFYQNQLTKNNVASTTAGSFTWISLYTVIHDCNLILKYVPGISFSSERQKNNILAQAFAMRAYVYFILTRVWGDVILTDAPTEGYSSEGILKERSPQNEVMAFIKQDIETGLSLFETNEYTDGRNKWSRPALLALKADVYLWSGRRLNGGEPDISAALKALEDIEDSDVGLLEDYSSVFNYNNKGNKEILMAIRFQDLESGSNINLFMYMMEVFMTENTDDQTKREIGAFGGAPYMAPTELVRKQFSDDDQRKKVSFIEIYNYNGNGSKSFYGSVVSKFKGIEVGGERRFVDDLILYRYADILLMKAEAKNLLNMDPADEINKVRKRAYGANFEKYRFGNVNKENNDDIILKERLLELIFEGKRWWDLVRFDKAFDLVPSLQNRKGQDHLLLFPISEHTLSLEPKVKQNPGYE